MEKPVPLSTSVRSATENLKSMDQVSAWEIVRQILNIHPEYGNHLGNKLLELFLGTPEPQKRMLPLGSWLEKLFNLFDMDLLEQKVNVIDGRLAVWGLAQLEPELRKFLDRFNFLAIIEDEYKEMSKIPPRELLRGSVQSQDQVTEEKKGEPRKRKTGEPYFPPVAGYISDRVSDDAADLLNIEREVANIANVLTFKQVQPPLAIGLFGDWGSGKSFFMGKLRKYLAKISGHYLEEEKKTGVEALWCSRVAQIEFNAWHFSDANLWASLVTRIYEGLDRELRGDKEMAEELKKKIIESQIQETKEKTLVAESQLNQAKERVGKANEVLQSKKKAREEKEDTFKKLIDSLSDLIKDSSVKHSLKKAARTLGIPNAAESYEALEELKDELKTVSGKFTAVTMSLFNSPVTLLLMVTLVILLPIGITYCIERWGGLLTELSRRMAEMSTFLVSLVGWLQAQVRRGMRSIHVVEDALQKARNNRQKRVETDGKVIQAEKALVEAQIEEQAARTHLEGAQTELQRLQDELQELRPERKLQRLIEERTNTGAYAMHLGIISSIRSDFENMSRLLTDMIEERRDLKNSKPPIQRIILYVDDLDRCKPERVVEVLEALHLLLFFPLFVVVVAVDPRWLRHSLSQHYPATLSANGKVVMLDGHVGMSLYSTPQDYLEKIFQIPFALRPVEKGGYQSLVNDLLKPLPKRGVKGAIPPLGQNQETGKVATPAGGQFLAAEGKQSNVSEPLGQGLTKHGQQDIEQGNEPIEPPFVPIPPNQLKFTDWEKEDMQKLWPMFRTPRTVKRFVNIYRLLRAGLVTDKSVKEFEGEKQSPGEYQVALLLLAAITGFPNEATRFLYRLDAWLDEQELSQRDTTASNWRDIIQFLRAEPGFDTREERGMPVEEEVRLDKPERKDLAGSQDGEETNETVSSWDFMLDCIERIAQEKTWASFKLTALRTWVMRVARYSFSVQPTQCRDNMNR